jgi:hypothetical protein
MVGIGPLVVEDSLDSVKTEALLKMKEYFLTILGVIRVLYGKQGHQETGMMMVVGIQVIIV